MLSFLELRVVIPIFLDEETDFPEIHLDGKAELVLEPSLILKSVIFN